MNDIVRAIVTAIGSSLATYGFCTVNITWGSIFMGFLFGLVFYGLLLRDTELDQQKDKLRRIKK